MQCINCRNRYVLRPLPDDSYTFCYPTETVDNIDLGIDLGEDLSPVIKKYWNGKIKCPRFKKGRSISEPPVGKPFDVPAKRVSMENILLKRLNV